MVTKNRNIFLSLTLEILVYGYYVRSKNKQLLVIHLCIETTVEQSDDRFYYTKVLHLLLFAMLSLWHSKCILCAYTQIFKSWVINLHIF